MSESGKHVLQSINTESLSGKKRNHAIVIGGGLSGLLAARVLTDFFEKVTIIERDHYPDTPSPRAGTPQANHVHFLFERGYRNILDLFPTFAHDLKAQGTIFITPETPPFTVITPHGHFYSGPVGKETNYAARAVIEWCIYRSVIRRPEIQLREGWEVTGLITIPVQEQIRVIGVRLRERGSKGHTQSLDADFIVDASGRTSPVLTWLEQLHLELPTIETVSPLLGYASRYYKKTGEYLSHTTANACAMGFSEPSGRRFIPSLGWCMGRSRSWDDRLLSTNR